MDFNKVINSPRIGEYKSSCVPKVERNDLFTAKLLWKRHSIKSQNVKTLHQNSYFFCHIDTLSKHFDEMKKILSKKLKH